MRRGLQIQSSPAQSLLAKKKKEREDADGLAKVGRNGGIVHCKFATQSQQGAVVSQTSQKSQFPEYIVLC